MSNDSSRRFETTVWSMVEAAQRRDTPESLQAMNRFMARYWKPVFYFLRARGYALHQAEDLTQEFFLQFFERFWMRWANPQRGRFRTFLLTVLTRFLADQGAERAPKQKSFDQRLVLISTLVGDSERLFEPVETETPELVFMRQWARATIDTVERSLEAWCNEQGRPDWYQIFSLHHFPPPGMGRLSQQEIAGRFQLSRDQVRYALDQANAQFVTLLRGEVAEQVAPPIRMEDEILELERLLGNAGRRAEGAC